METPTQEQLVEEDGLEIVSRVSDASWRHGTYETQVFHRKTDDTFWEVTFRLSTDGETNELTDGGYYIKQVHPQERVVVVYV